MKRKSDFITPTKNEFRYDENPSYLDVSDEDSYEIDENNFTPTQSRVYRHIDRYHDSYEEVDDNSDFYENIHELDQGTNFGPPQMERQDHHRMDNNAYTFQAPMERTSMEIILNSYDDNIMVDEDIKMERKTQEIIPLKSTYNDNSYKRNKNETNTRRIFKVQNFSRNNNTYFINPNLRNQKNAFLGQFKKGKNYYNEQNWNNRVRNENETRINKIDNGMNLYGNNVTVSNIIKRNDMFEKINGVRRNNNNFNNIQYNFNEQNNFMNNNENYYGNNNNYENHNGNKNGNKRMNMEVQNLYENVNVESEMNVTIDWERMLEDDSIDPDDEQFTNSLMEEDDFDLDKEVFDFQKEKEEEIEKKEYINKNEKAKLKMEKMCDFKYWKGRIESALINYYKEKGVLKLFKWQAICLEYYFSEENLFFSVPTSGGKTFIAEVFIMKKLFERTQKKRLILYVCPLRSLVSEKIKSLRKIVDPYGLCVEDNYKVRKKFKVARPPREEPNIIVCTNEKSNGIVNDLIEISELHRLSLVIIDEVHTVGDETRGHVIEGLISKILYYEKKSNKRIQIVGMSATISNLDVLAKWANGNMFQSTERPVPLNEKIMKTYTDIGMVFIKDDSKEELQIERKIEYKVNLKAKRTKFYHSQMYLPLVVELVIECKDKNQSCLVFCYSRKNCVVTATHLYHQMRKVERKLSRKSFSKETIKRRQSLSSTLRKISFEKISRTRIDPNDDKPFQPNYNLIMEGIAYHNAGLCSEEKEEIENAFIGGYIDTLCCTTSLAVGVNLPCSRVIFTSLRTGLVDLSKVKYTQASGRAGRSSDCPGESYLIVKDAKGFKKGLKLLSGKLKPIQSSFSIERNDRGTMNLSNVILECLSTNLLSTSADVESFFKSTFLHMSLGNDFEKSKIFLHTSISILIKKKLVNVEEITGRNIVRYCCNKKGSGLFKSWYGIQVGEIIFNDLERLKQKNNLTNYLQLLYVATSPFPPFHQSNLYQRIEKIIVRKERHYKNIKLVIQFMEIDDEEGNYLNQIVDDCGRCENEEVLIRYNRYKRLYQALILLDVLNEIPLINIANEYNVSHGMIEKMKSECYGATEGLCKYIKPLNWCFVLPLLKELKKRLHFGVKNDLLDLVRIPSLTKKFARSLYKKKIKTVSDVVQVSQSLMVKYFEEDLAYTQKASPKSKGKSLKRRKISMENEKLKKISIQILKEAKEIKEREDMDISNSINNSFESPYSNRRKSVSLSRNSFGNSNVLWYKIIDNITGINFKLCEIIYVSNDFIKRIESQEGIAVKFIYNKNDILNGIALYFRGYSYYINMLSTKICSDFTFFFTQILPSKEITKYIFNVKNILTKMYKQGYTINNYHDPYVMHYIEAPREELPNVIKTIRDIILYYSYWKKLNKKVSLNIQNFKCIALLDAYFVKKVCKKLSDKLCELKTYELYKHMEIPIIPVLAKMQYHGIYVNVQRVKETEKNVEEKMKEIEMEIGKYNDGIEVDLDSWMKVGSFLFKKLRLKYPRDEKMTKDGSFKTNKEILEKLEHPAALSIMRYRKYKKLLTDDLKKVIFDLKIEKRDSNGKSNSIRHMQWQQCHSSNGRISSSFQTTKKEDSQTTYDGEKLSGRLSYESRKGFTFISFDFCQIEARMIMLLSKQTDMIGLMNNERNDFFRIMAAYLFKNNDISKVTKEDRKNTKGIFYAVYYGMGNKSLNTRLNNVNGVVMDAREYREKFFKRLPEVENFIKEMEIQSRKELVSRTIFGRKKDFSVSKSSSGKKRYVKKNSYISHQISGAASDIFKIGIIEINKYIERNKEKFKANFVVLLHDEYVIEVENEFVELVARDIRKILMDIPTCNLTRFFLGGRNLGINLFVGVAKGKNWGMLL